jgi:hypothetical protein
MNTSETELNRKRTLKGMACDVISKQLLQVSRFLLGRASFTGRVPLAATLLLAAMSQWTLTSHGPQQLSDPTHFRSDSVRMITSLTLLR